MDNLVRHAASTILAQAQLQDAGVGTVVGLWASRIGNYLALTATVGLLLVAVAVLPASAQLSPASTAAARRAGVAAGLWALSALGLFVFGMSNAAARPLPEAMQAELWTRFAATRFGIAVIGQGVVAVTVGAVAAVARTPAGAAAALVAAAAGGFAPAWWGHAGTTEPRILALASDWIHIVAVTVWLGGLAALSWLALRHRDVPLGQPLSRFSRFAGWALAAVLATGVVNALLGISEPHQLVDTTWGRLVLVKLGILGAVALLAQRQRSWVVPRLRRDDTVAATRRTFRRLALAEVGLMVVAVGVAASMAGGVPADAEAAARVESIATGFGEGQLNLTLDPATAGANELHLYVFDATGRLSGDVADPSVTFHNDGTTVEADLIVAGPGHWTAPAINLPASGRWRVRIAADVDADAVDVTGVITVR